MDVRLQEILQFRAIVRNLDKSSRRELRQSGSSEFQAKRQKLDWICHKLAGKYRPFPTPEAVENALPSEQSRTSRGREFDDRSYIYLQAPEREVFQPLLQIKAYDFNRRHCPELRLRLLLFRLDDRKELQGFGLRFEAPEDGGTESRHGYYHCQLIENSLPGLKDVWVPKSIPAFPLDARNSIQLLITLLISLYGSKRAGKLVSIDSIGSLSELYETMHFCCWPKYYED